MQQHTPVPNVLDAVDLHVRASTSRIYVHVQDNGSDQNNALFGILLVWQSIAPWYDSLEEKEEYICSFNQPIIISEDYVLCMHDMRAKHGAAGGLFEDGALTSVADTFSRSSYRSFASNVPSPSPAWKNDSDAMASVSALSQPAAASAIANRVE